MTNEYSRMAPTNEADLITQSTHPLAERCKTREWHPSRSQRWLVNSTRTWCKLSEIWSRHGRKLTGEIFPALNTETKRGSFAPATPWPRLSVCPADLSQIDTDDFCPADLADFFDHGSTRIYTDDLRRTRIIGAARAETQARLMSLPSRDDNGRSQLHELHE